MYFLKKEIKILLISSLIFAFNIYSKDIWISDEIEAPLRAKSEMNSEIIGLLPAGIKIKQLATNSNSDYVQIETDKGVKGWMSKYYILEKQSVHDKYLVIDDKIKTLENNLKKTESLLQQKTKQLTDLESEHVELKAQNAKLTNVHTDNKIYETTIREQNNKIKQLSEAYEKANTQANDASVKYLSLSKVSENVIEVENQNKNLQETNLKQEQELQLVKSENQEIRAKLNSNERIFGGLLVFGGLFFGYILSSLFPARRKVSYGTPI